MLLIWKKSTPKNHLGNWKGKLTVQKRFLLRRMPIPWGVLPRKPPKDRSETPVPRVKKRRVSAANVEKEDKKLKSQVEKFDKRTKWKKGCDWRFTSTAVKDSIRTWKKGLRTTVSNSMQWRKHSKAKLLVIKDSWDTQIEFTIWQDYHFPN